MASLDDQLYQLFSGLLKNSKNKEGLTFDQVLLETGEGPYISSKPDNPDLGPHNSLLGYGHPLTYKSRIKALLSPRVYASHDELTSFVEELNFFLQSITGTEIYAQLFSSADFTSLSVGRHTSFISQSDLAQIQENKTMLVSNLFSFPITLSNKKSSSDINLSMSSYQEAISLLKLIKLGDFYGDNGHISRNFILTKDTLEDLPRVKKVEGLLIYLEQDNSYSFLNEGENIIYLPLFFKPSFLKELKKIIMD